MNFKELAEKQILHDLNYLFIPGEQRDFFEKINQEFLNNYIYSKESIYHAFDNDFFIIKPVNFKNIDNLNSALDRKRLTNRLEIYLKNTAKFDEAITNLIMDYTKNIMIYNDYFDSSTNKITNSYLDYAIRVGESNTKALTKFVLNHCDSSYDKQLLRRQIGDMYSDYFNLLLENNYISNTKYLRLSISPSDYFSMGYTRTQTSCTRVNSSYESLYNNESYSKAIFGYLLSPVFVATLHNTLESAEKGKEGDYRQLFYYDDDYILAMRSYSNSSAVASFLTQQTLEFFTNSKEYPINNTLKKLLDNDYNCDILNKFYLDADGLYDDHYAGYYDCLHWKEYDDYHLAITYEFANNNKHKDQYELSTGILADIGCNLNNCILNMIDNEISPLIFAQSNDIKGNLGYTYTSTDFSSDELINAKSYALSQKLKQQKYDELEIFTTFYDSENEKTVHIHAETYEELFDNILIEDRMCNGELLRIPEKNKNELNLISLNRNKLDMNSDEYYKNILLKLHEFKGVNFKIYGITKEEAIQSEKSIAKSNNKEINNNLLNKTNYTKPIFSNKSKMKKNRGR